MKNKVIEILKELANEIIKTVSSGSGNPKLINEYATRIDAEYSSGDGENHTKTMQKQDGESYHVACQNCGTTKKPLQMIPFRNNEQVVGLLMACDSCKGELYGQRFDREEKLHPASESAHITEGEIKQAASEYEKIACCEKDHPWLKEYVNEDFEAGANWAISKGSYLTAPGFEHLPDDAEYSNVQSDHTIMENKGLKPVSEKLFLVTYRYTNRTDASIHEEKVYAENCVNACNKVCENHNYEVEWHTVKELNQ